MTLIRDDEETFEVKHLNQTEFEAVLNHIEDPAFKLSWRVARVTGARIGELLAMKSGNVSSDKQTVVIKSQLKRAEHKARERSKLSKLKSKKEDVSRTVFVLPEARKLIEALV